MSGRNVAAPALLDAATSWNRKGSSDGIRQHTRGDSAASLRFAARIFCAMKKRLRLRAQVADRPDRVGDILVQWFAGGSLGGGVITVPAEQFGIDRVVAAALAELSAAAYLLNEQKLFGIRAEQAGIAVEFGAELALEALHGNGATSELRSFSHPLRIRYADAKLSVATTPITAPVFLRGIRLDKAEPEPLSVQVMGEQVQLTYHAVHQFATRSNAKSLACAYRRLLAWADNATTEVHVSPLVLMEKQLRYGKEARYVRDQKGWHGTIVDGKLLTMFFRLD